MAKFNTPRVRAAVSSPIRTEAKPSGRTYEGAPGYARDTRSELFLLAVSNMVGEETFYEGAGDRDDRFRSLVREVAVSDVEWLAAFLPWLRNEANMRSAPIVAALEAVRARLDAGLHGGNRQLVAGVLRRADEPGEALAYWIARYGRAIPKPVKRGIGDAVLRLGTEFNYVKWGSEGKGIGFAQILNLVHPGDRKGSAQGGRFQGPWQHDLFGYVVKRPYQPDTGIPESLETLTRREALLSMPVDERRQVLEDPEVLQRAGITWEALAGWLQGPMDAKAWKAIAPSMGYMACLAEGTPVWLADGTTAPVEDVVASKLPVLSYDKAWDARPVKYGPGQGQRDHSVGNLVPTVPSAWLDTGVRPVAAVRFASGRVIEATYDHRWVRQRRTGRRAWEWTTTGELEVGDRIPTPLSANNFGDEGDAWDGYFVGAMLGDGGMTALTPEFHGDPNDGAVGFMREYAAKYGCDVREDVNGSIVRMRFPFKQWKRNPLAEKLRRYEVWGKRCEVKALPNRPFSREFWIGALSGLIDTDGCVRERTNAKGTLHGSVEYATISRRLAEQVSDALLRFGVTSIVREKAPRSAPGAPIQSRHPIFIVEVNRATAIVRLSEVLDLKIGYKAVRLASLSERLVHVVPAHSEMHGYDNSVALDRVVAIDDAGERATYCVTVDASNLFVANGIVTGNCLRNLRNFDQAGVSDRAAEKIAARLADPDQVARSRQFPFRFFSAYLAAPSLRWGHALDKALTASTVNIPALPGRTLVLVDTSASMGSRVSSRSQMSYAQMAALFGVALAARGNAVDLHGFADGTFHHQVGRGASVLREVERFVHRIGEVGHGTRIAEAVRVTYLGHDRVIILSDMQTFAGGWAGNVTDAAPQHVPMYAFNLAGYARGAIPAGAGTRHELGGMSDQTFKQIPLLEAGRNASWPWA